MYLRFLSTADSSELFFGSFVKIELDRNALVVDEKSQLGVLKLKAHKASASRVKSWRTDFGRVNLDLTPSTILSSTHGLKINCSHSCVYRHFVDSEMKALPPWCSPTSTYPV